LISIVSVLRYAAPVAFAGVGESVVQKSGIINIGIEGTMLSSAYAATVVSLATGNPWIGVLAGAVVGIMIGLVVGLFTVTLSQDQIVVGTAINLLSLGVCGTLFERRSATGKLLNLPALPTFNLFGKFDLMLILLLVSIAVIWWLVYKTNWGLKLRAVGEYPPAVEASGFSATRIRFVALMIGGLFGGLGGAYYALGIAQSFATEMIAGRGFVAIALVTFGRWKPVWIVVAALLIGVFEAFQYQLQLSQSSIPKSLLLALPYVATLVILVISGKATNPPQALGVPYKKEG
jgi:general nucleoside transport system permease protein